MCVGLRLELHIGGAHPRTAMPADGRIRPDLVTTAVARSDQAVDVLADPPMKADITR